MDYSNKFIVYLSDLKVDTSILNAKRMFYFTVNMFCEIYRKQNTYK